MCSPLQREDLIRNTDLVFSSVVEMMNLEINEEVLPIAKYLSSDTRYGGVYL